MTTDPRRPCGHHVLDGRNAFLSDGVLRALGRPPRDFTEYAAAAAATGVWSDSSRARTDESFR